MNNKLTIYHVNIRHWLSNRYLLATDIVNYQPDIILVNETNVVNAPIKLKGYYCFHSCKELHSGVAIFIKLNLTFHYLVINNNSDPFTLCVKVQTSLGPVLIATSYSPPRHSFINTVTLNKILDYNLPTLIIADFNAHHSYFNNGKRPDTKGKQLFTFCQNRNVSCLGPDFFTFRGPMGKGTPDIILASSSFKMFHYHIAEGSFIGSDHIPIIFTFSALPIRKSTPKINNHKLNIDGYQSDLNTHSFSEFHNRPVSTIDTAVDTIHNNILLARSHNCPPATIQTYLSYHPTAAIKQKLKQFQSAYSSYLRRGFPSIAVINKYKLEFLALVKGHASSHWHSIVALASDCYGNPSLFWNKVGRLMGRKSKHFSHLVMPPPDEDDSVISLDYTEGDSISEPIDKAHLMSNVWSRVFRPHTGPEFENNNTRQVASWFTDNLHSFQPASTVDLTSLAASHPLLRPIEAEEYHGVLKSFKKHKAPGPSGISIILIQFLPPNYHKHIRSLYNAILASRYWPFIFKTSTMIFLNKPQKSPTNPLNYRPISLLEVLAKLFEKILSKRLLYYLEYNNILPQFQFGFRPGRSTIHSISIMKELLLECRRQSRPTLIATRDITKAFDTVWHQGLLFKIANILNLGSHFTSLIFNYLINRFITPYFASTSGPPFSPSAGVPQGSCLGPILFLIFVHDLPPPVYPSTLLFQFADDLVHITPSDSRAASKHKVKNAIRKLEFELENTLVWEENWRIQTSLDKCSVLHTGTSRITMENLAGVIVRDAQIPIIEPLRILGYNFTSRLLDSTHVNFIAGRARHELFKLRRFSSAPEYIRQRLYLTLIRPVLEYPSLELYNTTKTNIKKLQAIQNNALRFIAGVTWKDFVSSENLHQRLKIQPLNIRLHHLAFKTKFKMRDTYLDNNFITYHKLITDFSFVEPPLCQRQPSQLELLKSEIYSLHGDRSPTIQSLPPSIEDIPPPPDPIYKY